MKEIIKKLATSLGDKFQAEYEAYCKNTGHIMHGAAMKADAMTKASFCETIEELEAMKTYYEIGIRQFETKNTPHGFKFHKDAMIELISLLK